MSARPSQGDSSDSGGGLLDQDDMSSIRLGTYEYSSFHHRQVEAAAMELWIRFNNNNKNAGAGGGGLSDDEREAMDLLGTWQKEYLEHSYPLLDLGTYRDQYGGMMMRSGEAKEEYRRE